MSKTNFTKVEEALNDGIRKIKIRQLLDETDDPNSSKESKAAYNPGKLTSSEETTEAEPSVNEVHNHLITSIQREIKSLQKKEPGILLKLGVSKIRLKKTIAHKLNLSEEEVEFLKQVKSKLDQYKRTYLNKPVKLPDDKLIETERKKHINKRFNIHDNWLPLT